MVQKYQVNIIDKSRNNICNVSSVKLKEERRLRVFENRMLRRIFGPKRDEVTGEMEKFT
jgi:hypothetical protein